MLQRAHFEMAAKSGLCTTHSETTPNWAEQLKGKKFAEWEKSKLERLPENAAHGLEMRTAQPYLKESITDNIY